jgi:hypothetical protein
MCRRDDEDQRVRIVQASRNVLLVISAALPGSVAAGTEALAGYVSLMDLDFAAWEWRQHAYRY